MPFEVFDATVEGLHDAGGPRRASVLAGSLRRTPPRAQSGTGVIGGFGQTVVLGHLGEVVLFPLLTVPSFPLYPSAVAAGIVPGASVAARVEIEEFVGDVVKQCSVMADQGESTGSGAQPLGEEGQ